jgi:uncharacterized repeat protein (TIGR03943 family)
LRNARWIGMRWLGVGLASVLAAVTLGLAITGRLGLYINPNSAWFAVTMSIVLLIGTVLSFALPLGAEADHGHDHGTPGEHDHDNEHAHSGHPVVAAASLAGGVLASGVVLLILAMPPASLSAEFAMSRNTGGAPPLFAGSDVVTLATTGDTAKFGVGDWATAFATATNTGAFDGDPVKLTGFVTPGTHGDFDLTRLVITHCVIDAQPAAVPVVGIGKAPGTGTWVTVTGTVRATSDGRLEIDAASVNKVPQPSDPYEY